MMNGIVTRVEFDHCTSLGQGLRHAADEQLLLLN